LGDEHPRLFLNDRRRPRTGSLLPHDDGLSAAADGSGGLGPGALESATQFGFLMGKLTFSCELDSGIKSLLFERIEKE
jgi:hypothetical protein